MLNSKKTALIGLLALSMTGMHAMAPVSTPQKYDLQKEFGYKHYAKKHGEAKAHVDYLRKLQILASALFTQNQLIDTTYALVDSLIAASQAEAKSLKLTPEDNQPLGVDKKMSYFTPKTSTALAIALRYRDLLQDTSTIHTLTPKDRAAIFSALRSHPDADVQYLGNVIAMNYLVDCTSKKANEALQVVQNLLLFVGEKSMPYIERVRNNAQTAHGIAALKPFDIFIISHVSELLNIPHIYMTAFLQGSNSSGIKFHFDNEREFYNQIKNAGKLLYDAVIAEMNNFIRQKTATYGTYAYRLEVPTELLPGIDTNILEKSAHMPPPIDTILADLALKKSDTCSSQKTTPSKNKSVCATQSAPTPRAEPAISQENDTSELPVQLNTDSLLESSGTVHMASSSYTFAEPYADTPMSKTAAQTKKITKTAHLTPLSADEPLFKDFNGTHNSRLRVYTSLASNNTDIPHFTLAPNVTQWLDNPQQALKDQRYYRETPADQALKNKGHSKYKYARAKAYYEKKHTDNNDDTMRMHMHVFHALPREIDACIQRYGQVKEQSSKQQRNQTHICITLPGEVMFADGNRQQGLFSYVINKESNVCFHRMFEPKELSTQILNPTLLDLDMNAVDE
ncbi:hypothetical protein CVU75_00545 [Candidatus Dependentiae bacterium HGW-Dependentiae-1]|nr:MAG: hypothetical protein CVU75_00545 [Candidatus Dependentiae bacterium HGW-Dependentiae-1]